MRRFLGEAVLAAFIIGLVPYAFADSEPGQAVKDIKSMTVAELEKAGDEKRALRNYPEAISYFQEALQRDNRNALIHNKLGMAQMFGGNVNAAKKSFEKAIQANPDFASAFSNIGVLHFRQKSLGNAVKYFRKAVTLDDKQAAFHVNLGVALFNQKKYELAMKEYARAFELDPDVLERSSRAGVTAQIANPEDRARFYFELAKILARRRDFENCLRYLKLAKDTGYGMMKDVYRDDQFSRLWDDARLHEIVAPPAAK